MFELRTVTQLVTLLGGPERVLEDFALTKGELKAWRIRNVPPRHRWMSLYVALVQLGKSFDPKLLGMTKKQLKELQGSKRSMYDINSVRDLIDALGGATDLAHGLDMTSMSVDHWCKTGHIPPGWHLRFYIEACRLQKTVNPIVFGLTEAQFAPLSRESSKRGTADSKHGIAARAVA